MTKIKLLDVFDSWLLYHEPRERVSHYSSNADACTRRMYWDWIGKEKSNPPTPGGCLKMKFGEAAEWIFEKFLEDTVGKEVSGFLLNSFQKQWKERYPVSGLKYPVTCVLDYVLDLEGYGEVGVELKSMFGQGIVNIARSNQPKESYLGQIKMYTTFTPFKRFVHPYLGRDNGYRTEFFLTDHPDGLQGDSNTIYPVNLDESFERFKAVESALETGVLPGRDYLVAIKDGDMKPKFVQDKVEYKSDWQCTYCDYQDLCWREMCIEYRKGSNAEMFQKRGEHVEELRRTTASW